MGVALLLVGATAPIYIDPAQIAGPRVPHLRRSLGKIRPKEQELVSSTTSGQFICENFIVQYLELDGIGFLRS